MTSDLQSMSIDCPSCRFYYGGYCGSRASTGPSGHPRYTCGFERRSPRGCGLEGRWFEARARDARVFETRPREMAAPLAEVAGTGAMEALGRDLQAGRRSGSGRTGSPTPGRPEAAEAGWAAGSGRSGSTRRRE